MAQLFGMERIAKISPKYFKANISASVDSETVANVECELRVTAADVEVRSIDGKIFFKAKIGSPEHVAIQLRRLYSELHKANRDSSYPEWSEFFIEELGTTTLATIEQFSDSADPFEATIAIEQKEHNSRFWMSVSEREFEKIVDGISTLRIFNFRRLGRF